MSVAALSFHCPFSLLRPVFFLAWVSVWLFHLVLVFRFLFFCRRLLRIFLLVVVGIFSLIFTSGAPLSFVGVFLPICPLVFPSASSSGMGMFLYPSFLPAVVFVDV